MPQDHNAFGHNASIVARLQQGDPEALRDLMDIYARDLSAIALGVTGARDLAEDVVQAVLIKIWEQRSKLHLVEDLRAYLSRITRNEALDVLRRENRHGRLAQVTATEEQPEGSEVVNAAIQALDEADIRSTLIRVLNQAGSRCREVFLLRWEADRSTEEIARELGITTATVYVQLHRAHKALAVYFKAKGGIP